MAIQLTQITTAKTSELENILKLAEHSKTAAESFAKTTKEIIKKADQIQTHLPTVENLDSSKGRHTLSAICSAIAAIAGAVFIGLVASSGGGGVAIAAAVVLTALASAGTFYAGYRRYQLGIQRELLANSPDLLKQIEENLAATCKDRQEKAQTEFVNKLTQNQLTNLQKNNEQLEKEKQELEKEKQELEKEKQKLEKEKQKLEKQAQKDANANLSSVQSTLNNVEANLPSDESTWTSDLAKFVMTGLVAAFAARYFPAPSFLH